MPVVQALTSVPITGLTPTWLFYGSMAGVLYSADRRPVVREIGQGSYAFVPFKADKQNGAVWVMDLGPTVSRRYRCGVVGVNAAAFLRVTSGVPGGNAVPTILTFFQDATPASPTSSVVDLTAAQAGLFLVQEPVVGVGSAQRKPWSDKGAVSIVDLGGDSTYRYQNYHWGDGKLEVIDLAQFDILASWPAELPQEPFGEDGATYAPVDDTIRTESETGPAQVRNRFTGGKLDDFTFQLVLNPAQMAVLDTFYRVTLAKVRKFTWTDFRTLLPANYRFKSPPKSEYFASQQPDGVNPVRHWWRVEISLEMLP